VTETRPDRIAAPIPAKAGVGLRFPHHRHVLDEQPAVAWFEVHPENYLAGAPCRVLETVRRDYPVSLHAVGLSLGSADRPDPDHLARLGRLIERIEPGLVSDHLAWSRAGGIYVADLLPLPYTDEALAIVCRNVDAAQTALGRRLLIENPSTYLRFRHATMGEAEFLAELVRRTGCGLLCDVNNAFVSASNHGLDAAAWLAALPPAAIGEIHLAGHAVRRLDGGGEIRIDNHGSAVDSVVWQLYEQALGLFGPVPTLIEWDVDIPDFPVLEAEAHAAQARLDRVPVGGRGHAGAE
jgi:uncharacterized protein